jgi:mRNA interferase HigB
MKLLNRTELDRFNKKHRDAAGWIANWLVLVEQAEWRSIQDVRRVFRSADGVAFRASKTVLTVFNVKGNEYRLLTVINYARQEVYVWRVMSHADYTKEKWKARL